MEYFQYKENRITGRYVTLEAISVILSAYEVYKLSLKGKSVQNREIPLYKIGEGETKILIWAQMHGNETTGTKAVLDLMKYLDHTQKYSPKVTIYIIPILNPDGAFWFTRVNYNKIDLNRDAYLATQPESQFLREVIYNINPDFCFNLHDQRTIFSVGEPPKSATISFLSPAYNPERNLNHTRAKAMEVIWVMNRFLQKKIGGHIGRFSDEFNTNCTGDYFTTLNYPIILFEAGHYPADYQREYARKMLFFAMLQAIDYIANTRVTGKYTQEYFSIPENQKQFCDILVRNPKNPKQNIAIQFEEILRNGLIIFQPKIMEIGELRGVYGHQTISLSQDYSTQKLNDFEFIKENILQDITPWVRELTQ